MGVATLRRASLLVLGCAALVGCDALFPERDIALPISNLDLDPRPGADDGTMLPPVGQVVEVAHGEVDGEEFGLTVFAANAAICVSVSGSATGGGSCGPMPGEGLPEFELFGSVARSSGELTASVSGLVDPDVASVWVVTADGERANAVLIPLEAQDIGAAVFLVFLAPDTEVASIVAADLAGNILEEFPLLSSGPGVGPGVPPTPGD